MRQASLDTYTVLPFIFYSLNLTGKDRINRLEIEINWSRDLLLNVGFRDRLHASNCFYFTKRKKKIQRERNQQTKWNEVLLAVKSPLIVPERFNSSTDCLSVPSPL